MGGLPFSWESSFLDNFPGCSSLDSAPGWTWPDSISAPRDDNYGNLLISRIGDSAPSAQPATDPARVLFQQPGLGGMLAAGLLAHDVGGHPQFSRPLEHREIGQHLSSEGTEAPGLVPVIRSQSQGIGPLPEPRLHPIQSPTG